MPDRSTLNLLNWEAVGDYLCLNEINVIVHLASMVGGIGANKRSPADFMYHNLLMGVNVLHESSLSPYIKKIINVGTICQYPKYTPVPFKEENMWNGYPEETNAPYGIAKRAIMEYGIALNNQHNMQIVNLMPVNMAGEYDNFHPMSSHVIPSIILKIDKAISEGKGVELWGTGQATREFLYAGDFAKSVWTAIKTKMKSDPINIGVGKEISINLLATNIAMRMEFKGGKISFGGQVSDGQPRRCLDVTKAKEILKFEAETSLPEMLDKEINYYYKLKQDNPELIKQYMEMIR
jgi:GDP-L-fucose synthase